MNLIHVVYSFARSGGTLVNQLLGVHPQCLVLSEVNPVASYKPVIEQAIGWLGLVEELEAKEFSRLPYHEQIITLRSRAAEQGKRLIVRDWVTVNFLPGCAGDSIVPSDQLEQKWYLQRAGLKSVPLVISRRAHAVYQSVKQNFSHLRDLELDVFAQSYLKYVQAVAEYPVVQVEYMRAQPDEALKDILRRFDLDGGDPEAMLKNFSYFKNCTGNNTLDVPSRSAMACQILPVKKTDLQEAAFSKIHPALLEADRLLGYE